MGTTRIRWRNVARLAAGAAVAGLLIALVGSMLKPKPPQPLPDDVGLGGVSGQAIAYAPAGPHRGRGGETADSRARHRPERPTQRSQDRTHHDVAARRDPHQRSRTAPPAPTPASAPDPPAPTPAPATPPSPAPPPAPASPPPPTQEEPPDAPSHEPDPDPPAAPAGPSQFGFEQ